MKITRHTPRLRDDDALRVQLLPESRWFPGLPWTKDGVGGEKRTVWWHGCDVRDAESLMVRLKARMRRRGLLLADACHAAMAAYPHEERRDAHGNRFADVVTVTGRLTTSYRTWSWRDQVFIIDVVEDAFVPITLCDFRDKSDGYIDGPDRSDVGDAVAAAYDLWQSAAYQYSRFIRIFHLCVEDIFRARGNDANVGLHWLVVNGREYLFEWSGARAFTRDGYRTHAPGHVVVS